MAATETVKVGKRGTVVIPLRLRRLLKIDEGSLLSLEERPEGVLVRAVVAVPLENYTPERKAEFLLSNAVDKQDYQEARAEVRAMGLDPDRIDHYRPAAKRPRPSRA